MAIEKKLIHFKKWSDFSSKKLSANEQNTQYTMGVDGALTTGAPDVLYQSICWIKDVKKMWTHGTLYDCSGGGSEDTYIAPFTVEDVGSLHNGGIATLSIPIALIEAVIAKKRVLIPSNFDFGNGFAELTYAEGYVGEADAGLIAFFFMLREMYSIYIDDAISDGAIIVSKEHIHRAVVPGPDEIVGITSIEQTTTSNADGGSNVVTVTLTNGTKSTFTVKNGSKGSVGEQGPKGDKGDKGDTGANGTNGTNGKDGADGATFTPSVDSAGNLSWTNNKGLTNPPTVNIKGPKGDAVEGAATEEYVNNSIANAITNVINASY